MDVLKNVTLGIYYYGRACAVLSVTGASLEFSYDGCPIFFDGLIAGSPPSKILIFGALFTF